MEKGKCWIEDDYRRIVKHLLAADGIVLASPVYFLHVTGQMKTFLDRSLAFGHKPRSTWKPGMAISVSAGYGESHTADYLASLLRVYGAFSIGTLTAMATAPGEFLGKDVVEARAADLAADLARAIREKRRYPATDRDLQFYQFMGNLVASNKDSVMKHDYKHWQENGLFNGFEHYIQQSITSLPDNSEVRDAWIKEMIAKQRMEKRAKGDEVRGEKGRSGPHTVKSCKELLEIMPLGFNSSAASGLEAIYQFEVNGDENFVAHLKIANGSCTYHEGPADSPSVIIKTPGEVWLAIARGELDGQQAFMGGKYKVEGDLSLLMRLSSLFS
jgi:multimeric flavodoxin WrbA/putative sterol carrier protein